MHLAHQSALVGRPGWEPARLLTLPQVGQEVGGSETSPGGPEDGPRLQGVDAPISVLIGTLNRGSGLAPNSPG